MENTRDFLAKLDEVKTDLLEKLEEMRRELSEKGYALIGLVKEAFEEQSIKYIFDPRTPWEVISKYGMGENFFEMHVIAKDGKIIIRAEQQMRTKKEAIPVLLLYLAEKNFDKSFGKAFVNMNDGEIVFEYTYRCDAEEKFDKDNFYTYFISCVILANECLQKTMDYARGAYTDSDRKKYTSMLEDALKLLKGETEAETELIGKRRPRVEERLERIRRERGSRPFPDLLADTWPIGNEEEADEDEDEVEGDFTEVTDEEPLIQLIEDEDDIA